MLAPSNPKVPHGQVTRTAGVKAVSSFSYLLDIPTLGQILSSKPPSQSLTSFPLLYLNGPWRFPSSSAVPLQSAFSLFSR